MAFAVFTVTFRDADQELRRVSRFGPSLSISSDGRSIKIILFYLLATFKICFYLNITCRLIIIISIKTIMIVQNLKIF